MERRPGYFLLHTQVAHSQLTLHLEETIKCHVASENSNSSIYPFYSFFYTGLVLADLTNKEIHTFVKSIVHVFCSLLCTEHKATGTRDGDFNRL